MLLELFSDVNLPSSSAQAAVAGIQGIAGEGSSGRVEVDEMPQNAGSTAELRQQNLATAALR